MQNDDRLIGCGESLVPPPPLPIPASLTIFGASPRPALVTVTRPSPGRRLVRAARAAAGFWAVAVGCVFLPGLHFVLVPTFLVVGIVAGLRRLRDVEIVARVQGVCPRCEQEEEFAAGNRLASSWPLDCPACHNRLTLVLDGGKAPPATRES
jgi:hypothetical protein